MRPERSMKDFTHRLTQLRGIACEEVVAVEYEEPATQAIYSVGTSIRFADGTKLDVQFWRPITRGRPLVSIFDHRQRYGLPAPVDALGMLREGLVGKQVEDVTMDEATGDLHFGFGGDVTLQVFNFTAFEVWEVRFPEGSGELSNYALANTEVK
jgi:hypothetical protein